MCMDKAEGAFLTIGELSRELGVPQHILRYWESRFPQLRPLQRSGNRRYYRPEDVAVARRIHQLLDVEGFTIKGAAKLLADQRPGAASPAPVAMPAREPERRTESELPTAAKLVERLRAVRTTLAEAIGESDGGD